MLFQLTLLGLITKILWFYHSQKFLWKQPLKYVILKQEGVFLMLSCWCFWMRGFICQVQFAPLCLSTLNLHLSDFTNKILTIKFWVVSLTSDIVNNMLPFQTPCISWTNGKKSFPYILGHPKKFTQRLLPSNIGLILRKLRVVVWLHSRRLTIYL